MFSPWNCQPSIIFEMTNMLQQQYVSGDYGMHVQQKHLIYIVLLVLRIFWIISEKKKNLKFHFILATQPKYLILCTYSLFFATVYQGCIYNITTGDYECKNTAFVNSVSVNWGPQKQCDSSCWCIRKLWINRITKGRFRMK